MKTTVPTTTLINYIVEDNYVNPQAVSCKFLSNLKNTNIFTNLRKKKIRVTTFPKVVKLVYFSSIY